MAQRANIIIDHTKVPANLTDFPVYVDLNTLPKALWADVRSTSLGHKLEAYWRFDEASGNAIDLANSVPLVNTSVTYSSSNARLNNGAVFNGSSSKMIATSNTSLDLSTMSISAWVYRSNTTTFFPIWNKTSGNGLTFRINATTNVLVLEKQGIANLASSSGTVPATTLTHVAATYNNTTGAYAFYINGALSGSGTISTQSFSWGGDRSIGNDGSLWAAGTIDELAVWSRVLTAAEITELYNAGAGTQHLIEGGDLRTYASDGSTQYAREVVSCKRLQRGLLNFWKLDEASGNAADSVGSLTLTQSNMTYSTGKLGNAAIFNGSNGKLAGTYPIDPDTLNEGMTISAWTYVTSSSYAHFVSFQENAGWGGIDLSISGGNYAARFGAGSTGYVFSTSTAVLTNQWVHLCITHDKGFNRYYVNGAEVASQAALALANTGSTFALGFDHGTTYLNGKMDEVGIWERALSAQEVSSMYNAGTGTLFTDFTKIVTGEMHVKVSGTLSSTVDTTIQLHTTATDTELAFDSTYGKYAVWTDYVAVYHLRNESESTSNQLTLTNNNSALFLNGKLGVDGNFARSASQWLSRAYNSNLNIGGGDFTVTGWAKKTTSDYEHIMGMGWDEATGNLLYSVNWRASPSNNIGFEWYGGSYQSVISSTNTTNGLWYKFAARRTGTTLSIRTDKNSSNTATGTLQTTTAGTFGIARGGAAPSAYLTGGVGEVRVRKSYVSDSWLDAEYDNQNSPSTFYSSATVLPGPANVKTVNGIASANVKTRNGITFSLVKGMNGL